MSAVRGGLALRLSSYRRLVVFAVAVEALRLTIGRGHDDEGRDIELARLYGACAGARVARARATAGVVALDRLCRGGGPVLFLNAASRPSDLRRQRRRVELKTVHVRQ